MWLGAAYDSADDLTFAIDGGNSSGVTTYSNVNSFSYRSDAWTAETSDTSRFDLAAAYDSSAGLTYATGGYVNPTYLATHNAYSYGSNAWTSETNTTTAVIDHGEVYDSSANLTYVIDGFSTSFAGSGYSNACVAYSYGSNAWTSEANDSYGIRRSLGSAYDSNANLTYAIGGQNSTPAYIAITTAYSHGSNAWTSETSESTARQQQGVAYDVVNKLTYSISGVGAGSNPLNSVEGYSHSSNAWTSEPSDVVGGTRFGLAAVYDVSALLTYAIDGYNFTSLLSTLTALQVQAPGSVLDSLILSDHARALAPNVRATEALIISDVGSAIHAVHDALLLVSRVDVSGEKVYCVDGLILSDQARLSYILKTLRDSLVLIDTALFSTLYRILGKWYAVGTGASGGSTLMTSTLGMSGWANASSPFNGATANCIGWNGANLWVLGGSGYNVTSSTIATSIDGVSWTIRSCPAFDNGGSVLNVVYANNMWIAAGTNPVSGSCLATSFDGINWTTKTTPFDGVGGQINSVTWNGSKWVAGGSTGISTCVLATSTNGTTWTRQVTPFDGGVVNSIVWAGSYWVAGGQDSTRSYTIMYSSNGVNWSVASTPLDGGVVNDMEWSGNFLVGVGGGPPITAIRLSLQDSGPNNVPLTVNVISKVSGVASPGGPAFGDGMLYNSTTTAYTLGTSGAVTGSAYSIEFLYKLASIASVPLIGRPTDQFYITGSSSSGWICYWRLSSGSYLSMTSGSGFYLAGTTYAIQLSWDGTTCRLFVNGTLVNSMAAASTYIAGAYEFYLQGSAGDVIDEVRVSGVARDVATYVTAPTPFVSDGSTNLLYHFDNYTTQRVPVVMTSPDGVNWTYRPSNFDNGIGLSAAWAPPGLWVVGGSVGGTPQRVMISNNGKSWVQLVSTPFDTTGQVLGLLGPLFYTVTTPSTPPFPAWVSGEGAGMIAAL